MKIFTILLFSIIFVGESKSFAFNESDPNLAITAEKPVALGDLNSSSQRELKNCHLQQINYVPAGKKSYEASVRIDYKDQIGAKGVKFVFVQISNPLMTDSELLKLQGLLEVRGVKVTGKTVLHGPTTDHLGNLTKNKICEDWVSEPSIPSQPHVPRTVDLKK